MRHPASRRSVSSRLPSRRYGHAARHSSGGALENLRSLLHDETHRDRSRALGELRHRSGAPGNGGRAVPAGRRNHVHR